MNTRLDPPPVPPLTTAERSRLRKRVMDKTRPTDRRPARRWIAPMVGVGAVAAAVAGTLVVTNRPTDDAGVAGPSTPAVTPAAVGVDLGAVQPSDLPKLIADCAFPDEQTGDVQIVWSRHVRGITKDSTTLVGLALNRKAKGPAFAKLGYRYCMSRVPPSGKLGAAASVGRTDDNAWRADPTPQRALVPLGGSDNDFTNDLRTLQAWHIYRALPDVARVEARYVVNGKPGPWTNGVVDGGFAYTEVQANGRFTVGQKLEEEVRAFDAHGNPIPVR